MRAVWKYTIPFPVDIFDLELPSGAKILHFAVQYDAPCIWALVDPDKSTETRTFRLVGTGHNLTNSEQRAYIGTVQMLRGKLIWHLFEVKKETSE